MPVLIDGNNLLFAVGRVRPGLTTAALDAARKWLVAQLEEHHPAGETVTVVFDASRKPRGQGDVGAVRVRFAPVADDLLEDLIAAEKQPRRLVVVSNDNRVRNAALHRGATAMKCLDYAEKYWLSSANRERAEVPVTSSAKPEGVTPEETRHWLEAFGEE